jgi:chorismate mutase
MTGDQISAVLDSLRGEIEEIDRALIALIARRVGVARAIGEAKRAAGLPTLDPAREARLVRDIGGLAREAGLEPEDLRAIFWQLIAMTRKAQEVEG